MKQRIQRFLVDKKFVLKIFILFALIASFQSFFLNQKTIQKGTQTLSSYNNYTIFKESFHHLKNKQDLYILYPEEHWDLYKYTPAFSVFFGLFATFPDLIGLSLWNLLNALILLFAIYYLPRMTTQQKGIALLIVLIELMTSMQNEQSNALVAGLIILTFGLLENKKYFFATCCIVFSVFIKLFGIIGFILFLFYPKKMKLALYTLFWISFFFIIPLLFVNLDHYLSLFISYKNMLLNDHSLSHGISIMGWLKTWFGINTNKNILVLAGLFSLLIPFIRLSEYKNYNFRLLALSSVLLWIVIFNHKAESATFIIAMSGVSLWFINAKKNILNITLFICAFTLTSLSPTDIFPKFLQNEFIIPFTLKAFPCILIWLKINYDMLVVKRNNLTEVPAI